MRAIISLTEEQTGNKLNINTDKIIFFEKRFYVSQVKVADALTRVKVVTETKEGSCVVLTNKKIICVKETELEINRKIMSSVEDFGYYFLNRFANNVFDVISSLKGWLI